MSGGQEGQAGGRGRGAYLFVGVVADGLEVLQTEVRVREADGLDEFLNHRGGFSLQLLGGDDHRVLHADVPPQLVHVAVETLLREPAHVGGVQNGHRTGDGRVEGRALGHHEAVEVLRRPMVHAPAHPVREGIAACVDVLHAPVVVARPQPVREVAHHDDVKRARVAQNLSQNEVLRQLDARAHDELVGPQRSVVGNVRQCVEHVVQVRVGEHHRANLLRQQTARVIEAAQHLIHGARGALRDAGDHDRWVAERVLQRLRSVREALFKPVVVARVQEAVVEVVSPQVEPHRFVVEAPERVQIRVSHFPPLGRLDVVGIGVFRVLEQAGDVRLPSATQNAMAGVGAVWRRLFAPGRELPAVVHIERRSQCQKNGSENEFRRQIGRQQNTAHRP